jgi:tetratricopeptide (TPR) repeat protein
VKDHRDDLSSDEEALDVGASAEDAELARLEAERLVELGHVEARLLHFDEALRCYERALELFRTHSDRNGEGKALGSLGNIHLCRSQHDAAIQRYMDACVIFREVGNRNAESIALGNIAQVLQLRGEYDRAIELYEKALAIHEAVGDLRSQGRICGHIGYVWRSRGRADLAVESHEQAIVIAREVGDRRAEAMNLGNMGDALCLLDQLDEAEVAFRQAIALSSDLSSIAVGAFYGSLALVLAQRGSADEAQELLVKGESLMGSDSREHAKFLCKKAQIFHLRGDSEGADLALLEAEGLVEESKLGDDIEVGQVVLATARFLRKSGTEDSTV